LGAKQILGPYNFWLFAEPKNIFGGFFLGSIKKNWDKKICSKKWDWSKDNIANGEREAWEGGVALPLLWTDTLLTGGSFHLCVRGGV